MLWSAIGTADFTIAPSRGDSKIGENRTFESCLVYLEIEFKTGKSCLFLLVLYNFIMQGKPVITTISTRGQTVIPVEIRRKLGLDEQCRVLWTIEGSTARITRVPDDPIEALWGVFKQLEGEPDLTANLIQDHQKERLNDHG